MLTGSVAQAKGNKSLPSIDAQPSLLSSLSLLAIFVAIWTLYGAISAAPAAIHNDMVEAYVRGREFQLGYAKHPPFGHGSPAFGLMCFPALIGRSHYWPRSMQASAYSAHGCLSGTLLTARGG